MQQVSNSGYNIPWWADTLNNPKALPDVCAGMLAGSAKPVFLPDACAGMLADSAKSAIEGEHRSSAELLLPFRMYKGSNHHAANQNRSFENNPRFSCCL